MIRNHPKGREKRISPSKGSREKKLRTTQGTNLKGVRRTKKKGNVDHQGGIYLFVRG